MFRESVQEPYILYELCYEFQEGTRTPNIK